MHVCAAVRGGLQLVVCPPALIHCPAMDGLNVSFIRTGAEGGLTVYQCYAAAPLGPAGAAVVYLR